MKALFLKEDKSLIIKELDKPTPSSGEALIQVRASALNHREIWIQKGLYPGMTLPCILGADGAGIVMELGDKENESWLHKEVIIYPGYDWGDQEIAPLKSFRVLGMPDPGTICEYMCVPIENLVEKPSYLSWLEAAAIPVASLTAWRALTKHGQISAGQNILITGIGGGVAQAGLSLALALKANVYVTSSSQTKIELAQASGATAGVNYKDEQWPKQMKELSGGIDMILDSSPSPVFDDYFKFLNYGARVVAYGSTGAPKTTINISKFFLRHIQFIGTAMGSPREFQTLLEFMDTHQIRPLIDKTFHFDDAVLAINALKEGNQVGKIVIEHS